MNDVASIVGLDGADLILIGEEKSSNPEHAADGDEEVVREGLIANEGEDLFFVVEMVLVVFVRDAGRYDFLLPIFKFLLNLHD